MSSLITTGKDRMSRCDVVYRISCFDCEASYVGQIKRQLKTRVQEHFSDIKKCGSPSVILAHRIEKNHDFDWQQVEILDVEPSALKISISEMIHIKKQQSGLNKQSDTDRLPDSYLPILNLFPPLSNRSLPP